MSVGYLLPALLTQLPLLAVLVAGLVVVSARRAHLGPRSVMLARLGLGLLVASQLCNMLWFAVFPQVVRSMGGTGSRYAVATASVGIVLSLLLAAGVGLLVAAVVTRAPAAPGAFPAAPGGFPAAPGGFPAAPGGFPAAPGGFPAGPGVQGPGHTAYPAPRNAPHDPTAYPPGS
ncbi:hypothetical protein [Couchioplanes azureus]|uniref:hypothetical protein n=1 Tax=Couchioplanes caeruleus TaxID=56438 RepID=UPI0016708218|nr:hypothetical protein [Couchioplanes caeruleus]